MIPHNPSLVTKAKKLVVQPTFKIEVDWTKTNTFVDETANVIGAVNGMQEKTFGEKILELEDFSFKLDNTSERFTPEIGTRATQIRDGKGRKVRVWIGYEGENILVSTGEIKRYKPNEKSKIVDVYCITAKADVFGKFVNAPILQNYRTDQLIKYICDSIGFSGYVFDVGSTIVSVASFDFSKNAWTLIKEVTQAERGLIYLDNDNNLIFKNNLNYTSFVATLQESLTTADHIDEFVPNLNYDDLVKKVIVNYSVFSKSTAEIDVVKLETSYDPTMASEVNFWFYYYQLYGLNLPAIWSMKLNGGESKKFIFKFRNELENKDIMATDIQSLVANINYEFWEYKVFVLPILVEGGYYVYANFYSISPVAGSTNISTSVSVVVNNIYADRIEITITNPSATIQMVATSFNIQGYEVTSQDFVYEKENPDITNGKIITINNDFITTTEVAKDVATELISQGKNVYDLVDLNVFTGFPYLQAGDVIEFTDSRNSLVKKLQISRNKWTFGEKGFSQRLECITAPNVQFISASDTLTLSESVNTNTVLNILRLDTIKRIDDIYLIWYD